MEARRVSENTCAKYVQCPEEHQYLREQKSKKQVKKRSFQRKKMKVKN